MTDPPVLLALLCHPQSMGGLGVPTCKTVGGEGAVLEVDGCTRCFLGNPLDNLHVGFEQEEFSGNTATVTIPLCNPEGSLLELVECLLSRHPREVVAFNR